MVSAIDQALGLLQDPSKNRAVRGEALRWIVYVVADLCQSLHVVGEDRGGNDVLLHFMRRQTNLHHFVRSRRVR